MSEQKPENLIRPARYQKRRDAILDGALKIFSERGIESTGLKEIAAHLGLTHPALYHYFRSKEQIVFEAVEKAMLDLIAVLEDSQKGVPAHAPTRLLVLCSAHILYELKESSIIPFVNSLLYGPLRDATTLDEAQKERIQDLQRIVLDAYRKIIAAGQQSGDFIEGSASVAAFGVLGTVSYTVFWYRADGALSAEAVARTVAAQALRSVSRLVEG